MAVSQTLTLTETDVLKESNSSKVRILWKSTQTGESWNGYTRTAIYYVSINDGTETKYTVNYTLPQNSAATIVDTTLLVPHRTNGTGTVTVRTWMDTGISAGIVEKTASINLTLIPRETTLDSLTKSSDYVNGTITAKYTPQNSAYYNQCSVYVKVNNTLTHIYTEKLDRKPSPYSIEFTSAQLSTIYSKVTNTATAVIYVKLQTFSDSGYKTKVGSDQAKEISLLLPTTVVPKATLTITPVNTNTWIAGKGIYVAGLSSATAELTTAKPGEGLPNNAYTASITCNGVTTSGTKLDVVLKQSGKITFTGTVTDTRRRTATDTEQINVLAYSSPSVTSMTVERGELNGTAWETKATGTDVRVAYKTTLALTDKGNVYAAKFEIDGGAKTPSNSTTSGLKSGTEYAAYFVDVNGDTSHTLKLTVTDSVGYAGGATITIPTTYITVEYNASGKGIAFGKTSETDAFECAMDAEFSGKLLHKQGNGFVHEISDTGWIELGLSANVSERENNVGHAGNGCKYRVINGNHVYVAFACDVPYSNAPIVVNANAIPQSYRPKQHIYGLSASGGRTVTALYVHYNGQIYINYIQQIAASSNTMSLTTWVDGYIDYFI